MAADCPRCPSSHVQAGPPLTAEARLAPTTTRSAALALLPLPSDGGWYTEIHRALLKIPEDKDDEPGTDLLNTFCSLMEASFIALLGTCQQAREYMRAWRVVFGKGMDDITGANVRTGIEGNFECTRHLRHFVRDERLNLRRSAFLERVGTDVMYRDGRGESILVGRQQTTLQAWVDLYFKRSKTINDALATAQVHLAMCRGNEKTAEAPIVLRVDSYRDSSGQQVFNMYWRTPYGSHMHIPLALHEGLGLEARGEFTVELKFEAEDGWSPFQRVTDSEANLIEGTVALLRAVDASTGNKSEWVRFSSLHWM